MEIVDLICVLFFVVVIIWCIARRQRPANDASEDKREW
jgi:hypothetical protein